MDFRALAKGQKQNSAKKPEPSKNNGKFEPRGLEGYHKKTNVKFLSAPDAARAKRAANLEEGRKMKRAETVLAKRGLQASNNSTNGDISTLSTASTLKSGKVSAGDARKEQLAKWKLEKAVINQKQNIPPPFKAGVAGASSNANAAGPKAKGPVAAPERRVTRAMAKLTVTVPDKPNPNSKAFTEVKRPVKSFNAASTGKGAPAGRPELKKAEQKALEKPKAKSSAPVVETVVAAAAPPAPAPAPAPAPKKKLKPKAIDRVYTEYNQLFSNACSALMEQSKTMMSILEAGGELPDDVGDEIRSFLGKVKLLLDSKLPQFGVLLYSYLVEGAEEGPPLLACDLQGWWDVANIQVVAVSSEFDKLLELQSRNWVKLPVIEEPKPVPSSSSNLGAQNVNNLKKTVPKPKPASTKAASSGFKAFLAMKRKEKVGDGAGSDSVDAEKEAKPKSPAENKFEGGFFEIKTPNRRASLINSRRSTLRIIGNGSAVGTPVTPGSRRVSASALGLKMLNFRQSMGSRCKLGAQPPLNSSIEKEEEEMEINN